MSQDSLPLLVGRLLRKNKIEFDKKELAFQIQSHPSYPSLHAITGVLDHLKINNMAAAVPVEEATINQMPETFMAQFGNDLAVVTQTSKGLQVQDSSLKERILSLTGFLEEFTGIVVVTEATEDAVAIDSSDNKNQSTLWLAVGAVFILLITLSEVSITPVVFLGLSLAGLGFSMAILKQEFGFSSTIGDAFCNNATEKRDCDAVINSKGAKVLGRYKISDFSLVYFISIALVGIICISLNKRTDVLYYASLFALPVTVYSIYYQAIIIKKWCALCLSIVGVLWLQATLTLLFLDFSFPVQGSSILLFTLFTLLVFSIWSYLRPKQGELKEGYLIRVKHEKFKRNFELFSTVLNTSQVIETRIDDPLEIVLGNEKALTEITMVTNPFCGHCKPIHTLIEDILGRYGDNVRLNIRFNINLKDKGSDLIKICTRLLEIYDTQGKDICLMAMSEIYGDSTSEEWLKKWSECQAPNNYVPLIETQKEWCQRHSINFTPEILINGLSYPKIYERADLIYFVEDLIEMEPETRQAVLKIPEEIT